MSAVPVTHAGEGPRRVVYDLRYATDHFTGTGTHAVELFRALLATRRDDVLVALWRRGERSSRFALDEFRGAPGVEWHEVEAPSLGVSSPWRTGAELRRLRADLYLSPYFLRPVDPRMPVVLTLHDAMHLVPEVGAPFAVRAKFALALHWAAGADAILTSSRFSLGEVPRLTRIPSSRLHLVPLGVPSATAAPVRPARGLPERPFALAVGGNRPHKNLALLARVWRDLGEAAPLDLVVAGAPDARHPGLAALGGTARTHALGAVSPGELEWLYAHATCLVFPTLYEGYGLPLVEAAARGLPVLCSDIPALRETGEGCAWFLPAHDERAWREAVVALAADAERRARMSADGRARAARLTYHACALRVRGVLQQVHGGAR